MHRCNQDVAPLFLSCCCCRRWPVRGSSERASSQLLTQTGWPLRLLHHLAPLAALLPGSCVSRPARPRPSDCVARVDGYVYYVPPAVGRAPSQQPQRTLSAARARCATDGAAERRSNSWVRFLDQNEVFERIAFHLHCQHDPKFGAASLEKEDSPFKTQHAGAPSATQAFESL
jgi:hypothetical protein